MSYEVEDDVTVGKEIFDSQEFRGLMLAGFLQARFADGRFVTYRTKLGEKNGGGVQDQCVLNQSGLFFLLTAKQEDQPVNPPPICLPLMFSCLFPAISPPVDFKKTRKQTNK